MRAFLRVRCPQKKQLLCRLFHDIISRKNERIDCTVELDNNNHSVFLLYYHLVLVVKYRRKVFSNQINQYAKDIFVRIGSSYNITLKQLPQWSKKSANYPYQAHQAILSLNISLTGRLMRQLQELSNQALLAF